MGGWDWTPPPPRNLLEECDLCGDENPLRLTQFTGAQFLCAKHRTDTEIVSKASMPGGGVTKPSAPESAGDGEERVERVLPGAK